MKKKCPICKKENLTSWKYCSSNCVVEAKHLARMNHYLFLKELEMEALPVDKHNIVTHQEYRNNLVLVDNNGRRVV